MRLVPRSFNSYFEPFLGGGALLFALRPNFARVSDLNEDLVAAYRCIKERPDVVIDGLEALSPDPRSYARIKLSRPSTLVARAVRLIYLNRTSWNGLYRVNGAGEFNVPFGRAKHFTETDAGLIRQVSEFLQSVNISHGDFENSVRRASSGDLVFLDPPYTVTHGENGFLLYNEKIFSWADQERLARVAWDLRSSGVHVIMTNANHSSILELYRGFEILPLNRRSVLAADPLRRRTVSELVISS